MATKSEHIPSIAIKMENDNFFFFFFNGVKLWNRNLENVALVSYLVPVENNLCFC